MDLLYICLLYHLSNLSVNYDMIFSIHFQKNERFSIESDLIQIRTIVAVKF